MAVGSQNLEVIAELAQGFEGSVEQALLLLKAASASGATSAKFQLIIANEICTPDYEYYKLFSDLEMPLASWRAIADLSEKLEINLILDVFGSESLALSQEIGVSDVMLHATDLNNVELLREVQSSDVSRVLLGVGGGYLSEIMQATDLLKQKRILLMFGYQSYPTPQDKLQLARISVFRDLMAKSSFSVELGYADHSLPESRDAASLSTLAIGLGVTTIEKHLTLGECMKLEDYESALNPDRFREFNELLQRCHSALGQPSKVEDFLMSENERSYRNKMRRHVVTKRPLNVGELIAENDVCLKRTASVDVHYNKLDVIGAVLLVDVDVDQVLNTRMLDKKLNKT